ncbi:MAG TPA: hypothetical protein VFT41_02145 [Gemmatimonadaceae bacterium]|nr:hypothetical protein [Gemmatimonadaceae bacterium]
MRFPLQALLTLGVLAPAAIAAQRPTVLAPDTRIRFAVARDTPSIVATVVAQRGDTLWVRPVRAADTLALGLSHLARLDVSRGKHTRALHHAGVGFLVGAVTGGVLGYATGTDCTSGEWICFPRSETAAFAGVAFGMIGAGVGAIVGWARPTERWEAVALPADARFTLTSDGRGGRRYGVRFTLTVP